MSSVSRPADPFGAMSALGGAGSYFRIGRLRELGLLDEPARLPFCLRVLLEGLLRNAGGKWVSEQDVLNLAGWQPRAAPRAEIPFLPARVVMQDFTGVPCLVDLAAMRDAVQAAGGDSTRVDPVVPVDLVIDHSVQVDVYGCPDALRRNSELEFERNRERYEFLRWGASRFRNVRIVPPATGIVHQVNLEYLAAGVLVRQLGGVRVLVPDTLVGTDSHTPMINGLGVLGWGVGGIEAEAAALGLPLAFAAPDVVGVRLHGTLRAGVTATDLVLTLTERLRRHGVVDAFIEYFGPGVSALTVADRATISNMAPEYGATCGFFPTDAETLRYLRDTGRADAADLLARYARQQGLFRADGDPDPVYSECVEVDLSEVQACVAGPKRPQDRIGLGDVKTSFRNSLSRPPREGGFGLPADPERRVTVTLGGKRVELSHGMVAIAAITSCTNTSNPGLMLGAGLLARKAVQAGLQVKPWVKTSLAPGSHVAALYLEKAGVLDALRTLGFDVVAYGCTTCIGNSGPLDAAVEGAIREGGLVAAAVLSGNRNFEGRINPHTKAGFLASPPLVVAYALAGTLDLDLTTEPLGLGRDGQPVFLRDIWPTPAELSGAMHAVTPDLFETGYHDIFAGNAQWKGVKVAGGDRYEWDPASTYIRQPPFFEGFTREPAQLRDIRGARVLAWLGDSVTTDHISPAGSIAVDSPAADYLRGLGVSPGQFNQYGARRGNHEVMMRGTFANPRIRNQLRDGAEGGNTVYFGAAGEILCSIYDAAMRYRAAGVPLVVLAGREYGTGSSRDWAAKGTRLLGVRAVLAESFERIHRSNLVGMGVLPLTFCKGGGAALGLTGREHFDLLGLADGLAPLARLEVVARSPEGGAIHFEVRAELNTPADVEILRHGGILAWVARGLL